MYMYLETEADFFLNACGTFERNLYLHVFRNRDRDRKSGRENINKRNANCLCQFFYKQEHSVKKKCGKHIYLLELAVDFLYRESYNVEIELSKER